ncbi:protein-O-mannosyltransferase 2 [Aspergillus fumigatus Z5]|nr:protein-O-mannosyltransferase 2 [Aspergillus fumigatus Z5]
MGLLGTWRSLAPMHWTVTRQIVILNIDNTWQVANVPDESKKVQKVQKVREVQKVQKVQKVREVQKVRKVQKVREVQKVRKI